MTVRHVVKNPEQEGDKCIVMEWELVIEDDALCVKGGRVGDACGTFYVFSVDRDGRGYLPACLPRDIGLAIDKQGRIVLNPPAVAKSRRGKR